MAMKFASQGSNITVKLPESIRSSQNVEIEQTVSYKPNRNKRNEYRELESCFPEIVDGYKLIKGTGRYNKTLSKKEYRNELKIKKTSEKVIDKI